MPADDDKIIWTGAKELEAFLVPVDDLVPFPDNPDRHDVYLPALAASLEHWGQTRAICTWSNAEEHGYPKNTIVAGHHLRKAAITYLNWSHVAAIAAEFESREKALGFLAADNLLSQREADEMRDQMSLLEDADAPKELETVLALAGRAPELEAMSELKAHPDNYKEHPPDQIEHIKASLEALGFYKPIVIAKDGTVLAGHGVMKAAAALGIERVPVTRLDVDPDSAAARVVLAGDNEIGRRAVLDDRALADQLRQLHEEVGNTMGTGYDLETFASLLLVTRTQAEIPDVNQAAEWIGLSEYEPVAIPTKVMVSFENEEKRDEFLDMIGANVRKKNLGTIGIWWPERERADPGKLRFVDKNREKWKEPA